MAEQGLEIPEEMLSCYQKASAFYNAVRDNHLKLGLTFSGQASPDGSVPQNGPGVTLLPSLTEMNDLGALISLVGNSWIQSQKMPTVEQLHSSAQSMDVDTVVFITMLFCTGMLGAFLPLICSGDLDMVSSILDGTNQIEVPPTTSANTFLKRTRVPLPGVSTPETPETTSSSSPTSGGAAPATKSGRKKKKKKQPQSYKGLIAQQKKASRKKRKPT